MDGHELRGADHGQVLEQLRADFVLAAVAARQREQHGPHSLPSAERREQPAVLIVGVGGHLEERGGGPELPQRQAERGVPGVLRNHPVLCPQHPERRRRERERRHGANDQDADRSFHEQYCLSGGPGLSLGRSGECRASRGGRDAGPLSRADGESLQNASKGPNSPASGSGTRVTTAAGCLPGAGSKDPVSIPTSPWPVSD